MQKNSLVVQNDLKTRVSATKKIILFLYLWFSIILVAELKVHSDHAATYYRWSYCFTKNYKSQQYPTAFPQRIVTCLNEPLPCFLKTRFTLIGHANEPLDMSVISTWGVNSNSFTLRTKNLSSLKTKNIQQNTFQRGKFLCLALDLKVLCVLKTRYLFHPDPKQDNPIVYSRKSNDLHLTHKTLSRFPTTQ